MGHTFSLAMSRVCMRPCDTILGSKSKSSISQRCRKSLKDICDTNTQFVSLLYMWQGRK